MISFRLIISLIVFQLWCYGALFSQENTIIDVLRKLDCSKIKADSWPEIDDKKDSTIIDLVVNNYLTEKITIDQLHNRFTLKKFKTDILSDYDFHSSLVTSYGIEIKVIIESCKKNIIDKFYFVIDGNQINVQEDVYGNFNFINFNNKYLYVRPIECFLSLDNRYILIYFFGGPIITFDKNGNISSILTDFTKLIFTVTGDYIGQLHIPYQIFSSYEISCNEFVGF